MLIFPKNKTTIQEKKEEYKTVRVTVETTREEEDQLNNTGYKFIRYDENRKEAIYRKRL